MAYTGQLTEGFLLKRYEPSPHINYRSFRLFVILIKTVYSMLQQTVLSILLSSFTVSVSIPFRFIPSRFIIFRLLPFLLISLFSFFNTVVLPLPSLYLFAPLTVAISVSCDCHFRYSSVSFPLQNRFPAALLRLLHFPFLYPLHRFQWLASFLRLSFLK